jgi:hypothetical protein
MIYQSNGKPARDKTDRIPNPYCVPRINRSEVIQIGSGQQGEFILRLMIRRFNYGDEES